MLLLNNFLILFFIFFISGCSLAINEKNLKKKIAKSLSITENQVNIEDIKKVEVNGINLIHAYVKTNEGDLIKLQVSYYICYSFFGKNIKKREKNNRQIQLRTFKTSNKIFMKQKNYVMLPLITSNSKAKR